MAILLIRLQFFENLLNVSYLHESLLLACSASNNVLAGRSKDSSGSLIGAVGYFLHHAALLIGACGYFTIC